MIKDLWYKNAVICCLNVGTFMDSNGDGIGDFEGLVRRLDFEVLSPAEPGILATPMGGAGTGS